MVNQDVIIIRVFDSPREKVWKMWTLPEFIVQWFGPTGFRVTHVFVDFRVGGKYVFAKHGPLGSEWENEVFVAGVFEEIFPMEKIVATDYYSDKNGIMQPDTQKTKVTFMFEDMINGKTKLSIAYTKNESNEQAWYTNLDKFDEVLSIYRQGI